MCCSAPGASCCGILSTNVEEGQGQYELKALRAEQATDASRFEDAYKQVRLADVEATRRALDVEEPEPRLTAAELAEFAAPDPYRAALDKMKEHQ